VVCLIEAGTRDHLLCKSRSHIFTKVELVLLSLTKLIFNHQKAPLQCSIQLHTKFQLTVYPLGMSKVQSLYTQINACISVKLCCVVTKISTRICLYTPYKCTKFQLDQNTCLRVRAKFVICAKKKKNWRTMKKLEFWSLISRKRLTQFTSNLVSSLPL